MKPTQKFFLLVSAIWLIQAAWAQNKSPPASPCPPSQPCPKPCPDPCCPTPCFEQGYPTGCECTLAGYNHPASFRLDPCAWNVYFDATFTYWIAEQEGMNLGQSNGIDVPSQPSPAPTAIRTFLFQDTAFKPGFKVGAGVDLGRRDDWSLYAEYTWFRSTTEIHNSVPPPDPLGGVASWNVVDWVLSALADATNVSSKWRLQMDLADLAISRPFYQGTRLIFSPFAGVRGTWIRQNFEISGDFLNAPPDPLFIPLHSTARHKSTSWAVGPRIGCEGKWHLGWGFRFEGDVAGSLLFTRYTKVKHAANPNLFSVALPASFNTVLAGHYHNYDCVRPQSELNLGVGWGTYFKNSKYHLDWVVSYDFQIFWNQNMMRQLLDDHSLSTGHSPSNLYLQGLTCKARFDF